MHDKKNSQPTFPHKVIGFEIKFDNIIKAWRTFLKMTQKELAQKAGITQATLSQMEKPGARPHGATLKKIAKAIKVDSELLKS
jgi:transcriptional regulator with XRE-family HTH domain